MTSKKTNVSPLRRDCALSTRPRRRHLDGYAPFAGCTTSGGTADYPRHQHIRSTYNGQCHRRRRTVDLPAGFRSLYSVGASAG